MLLVAIEFLKCTRGINPVCLTDMFSGKEPNYKLQDQSRLLQPSSNTKRYGYRPFQIVTKIWNSLSASIKDLENLGIFKKDLYNGWLTDHAHTLLSNQLWTTSFIRYDLAQFLNFICWPYISKSIFLHVVCCNMFIHSFLIHPDRIMHIFVNKESLFQTIAYSLLRYRAIVWTSAWLPLPSNI